MTTTLPPPPPPSSPLYVLVVAHPDDESMFFAPTLLSLMDKEVWIISLSKGNYDGLGKVRAQELLKAAQLLGVSHCLFGTLEDNPYVEWKSAEVAETLERMLSVEESIHVLTFDEGGISGHVNHKDTYRGVQYWLSTTTSQKNVTAWKLTTVYNPIYKYLPLLVVWQYLMALLFGDRSTAKSSSVTLPRDCFCWKPWIVWNAMATHASQFVWYRRLFVLFSCYTYHNQWQEIIPESECEEMKKTN